MFLENSVSVWTICIMHILSVTFNSFVSRIKMSILPVCYIDKIVALFVLISTVLDFPKELSEMFDPTKGEIND